MPVMLISDEAGQTPQACDDLLAEVGPALASAPGFGMHTSHPIDVGWREARIWTAREDAARFFAAPIAPHLPDGIRPKLTFTPLQDRLRASGRRTAATAR